MAERRIYWDSCCFIGLIQQEKDRYPNCRSVYTAAERGDIVLVTSALTISEVCKVRCERDQPRASWPEDNDHYLNNFFLGNEFFEIIDVTPSIATSARSLFRRHISLKKPNDAVHLATALFGNVDEMHTYDNDDFLALSGSLRRRDGEPLPIVEPPLLELDLLSSAREGKDDGDEAEAN